MQLSSHFGSAEQPAGEVVPLRPAVFQDLVALTRQSLELPARGIVEGPVRNLYRHLFSNRPYFKADQETILVMTRILKANSCCLDAGASSGSIFRHILRLAPQGNHFAFEPLPEAFAELHRKYGSSPNASLVNTALGSRPGSISFNRVKGALESSGLAPRKFSGRPVQLEKIEVRIETVDRLVPHDQRIDFMKIDVEGAELPLFRGASETIGRNRQRLHIIFEHEKCGASYFKTRPDDVYGELQNHGLSVFRLGDWLDNRAPLDLKAFKQIFEKGTEHYFLAKAA